MRICVTGSVATDHLMTFPGSFTDSLVADQLHTISLSFLVDDLQVRRGGVGANIAFGLGCLGLRPILLASVGEDFEDYRSWLERHGVDTTMVHQSQVAHTARFVCTTDAKQNQIASFYPGAMSEARNIEIGPVLQEAGQIDLVLVGPNDPEAMLRHTAECRQRGIPFAADPSQQLASMDGAAIRELIDGAAYLFTNEYEASLTEQKTGWTAEEILQRVGVRVTTLGKNGAKVETSAGEIARVGVPQEAQVADPTGVGDAFRAGYLAGVAWGLNAERCAQIGSMMATLVIETVGTQEYEFTASEFLDRFAQAYSQQSADEVSNVLQPA